MKIAAYEVATKEANEVRAVLRRLVINRATTEKEVARALTLAGAIIAMLTRTIITLEKR